MSRPFYLEKVKARGNRAFWRLAAEVEAFKHPDALLYWKANEIAYDSTLKRHKRNRVFKRTKRQLDDLWWDVYEATGLKINGLHLGALFLKQNGPPAASSDGM